MDNATAGETIIVSDGTYYENVNVWQQLVIQSENDTYNCIIDAGGVGSAITLNASGITIVGFIVRNSYGHPDAGIKVNSNDNIIRENYVCYNSENGIYLNSTMNNLLEMNVVDSNGDHGIYLNSSQSNTLIENTVSNSYCGIILAYSNSNNLDGNIVSYNHDDGIHLISSNDNTLEENSVCWNGAMLKLASTIQPMAAMAGGCGIYMESSTNNTIINNAIVSNTNGITLFNSCIINTIKNNNIHNNTVWNFQNLQTNDVIAENNFWNLFTEIEIDEKINDDEEGSGGTVDFDPWSDITNPVPEISTILMVSVGLLAVIVAAYRRRE